MGEPRSARQRKADLEVGAAISATDPFDPGYRLLRRAFDRAEIAALTPVLARIPSSAAGRRWAGRDLAALLQMPPMQPVARKLAELLPDMAIIHAVAFRKDADANWFVPAHQDRSIPVPSVALPPGFEHVTRKPDGWQAEAPVELLARMRNCRIFVDRATINDGPLEVLAGSHRRGRIEQAEIPTITGRIVAISAAIENDEDVPLRQYDKILFHPKSAIPVDFESDNQLYVVPVEDVVAVFRREDPNASSGD